MVIYAIRTLGNGRMGDDIAANNGAVDDDDVGEENDDAVGKGGANISAVHRPSSSLIWSGITVANTIDLLTV
jgi:hypothetical protein